MRDEARALRRADRHPIDADVGGRLTEDVPERVEEHQVASNDAWVDVLGLAKFRYEGVGQPKPHRRENGQSHACQGS